MIKYAPINRRKVRIALVGCGRISRNHFQAIKDHESDLELVAVCDSNEESLHSACSILSVPGFSSLELMIKETDLDVVSLCTPSGLHAEQAVALAEAGVHVITEKPMATRWTDGVRMVKACDAANVRLFVVKQNRLNATIQYLKRAIEEQRFGKIKMVHLNVFWTRPQEYYDQGSWRGTWEFDGGAFMNQASHYVDLLDWIIGPVEKVQAMMSTSRDIEVEDTGVLNVKWRSGALGSMSVTMLTYPRNLEGSITVLGEKGSAKVSGVAVNEIELWEFDDSMDYDSAIMEANYETGSVYGFGHSAYYENVVKCLRGEVEPYTDGREGLKSLELLVAAYLSARDGTAVSLPLSF